MITALHAKNGDVVNTGQPLVDFQIDGANGAPPAKSAPTAPPRVDPKKADDSGTVVGNMPTSDEEFIENAVAGGAGTAKVERVRAAPAVRALAKRLGVDLTQVHASGRGGLITVDDVMSAGGTPSARAPAARAPSPAPAPSRPAVATHRRGRAIAWTATWHGAHHVARARFGRELHAFR